MNPAHRRFFLGTASEGVCTTPDVWISPVAPASMSEDVVSQKLSLETCETYLNPVEQRFYDWSIGKLEDAGVVGALEAGDVYLGASFRGRIYTGVMPTDTVTRGSGTHGSSGHLNICAATRPRTAGWPSPPPSAGPPLWNVSPRLPCRRCRVT